MTFDRATSVAFPRVGRRPFVRDLLSQSAFAIISLAVFGAGCACFIASRDDAAPAVSPAPLVKVAHATASLKTVALDNAILAENYLAGRARYLFAQSAPLRANFRPSVVDAPPAAVPAAPVTPLAAVEAMGPPMPTDMMVARADVPVPAPRPREFSLLSRMLGARQTTPTATPAPAAPTETKGIFDRLFGRSSEPTGPALAYANPQDGVTGKPQMNDAAPLSTYDRSATAIYDISAKVVHLPDGTRLEAHSGLGEMLDDPRNVHVRMRGATPPAVYDLTMREALFHGVQAIRLTPVNSKVFGRAGLLAHTFMLGPNGDSNGCVSFRNYDAFLQAFQAGRIKRLEVVARL